MHTASANARHARLCTQLLSAGGIERAVVSPGSRNAPLLVAFEECPDIDVDVLLDERCASFFALGLAKASKRPVALLCTSGTAGAHYLPAIIEASQSRIPLVVVTADRPFELQDCGAPQTIAQKDIFGEHVRWRKHIEAPTHDLNPDWYGTIIAQAMHACCSEPAGPVHLNLAYRTPLWTTDTPNEESKEFVRAKQVIRGPAYLSSSQLDAIADGIAGLQRGVLLCGPSQGNNNDRGDFAHAIARLGAHLGWPVIADPLSQVRFGPHTRNAAVVAHGHALLSDPNFSENHTPQRILQFGRVPTSKAIADWLARVGRKRTALIDEAGVWLDPSHTADELWACSPTLLCQELLRRLPQRRDAVWARRWQKADTIADEILRKSCDTDELWEGFLARSLAELLPPDANLHVSNSLPIRDLDCFSGTSDRQLRIFGNRGANGIDGTIATALGEAVASQRPTALLVGDLSLYHDLGGLAATKAYKAHLVIVVVDNGGGRIFHQLSIADHPRFERLFLTPQHSFSRPETVRITDPDLVQTSSTAAFTEAFQRAVSGPSRTTIIQAQVDGIAGHKRRENALAQVAEALQQLSPFTNHF